MSDTTPRLALAELTAAQAQKHVTVNEALIKLDALIDTYLTSMSLTAPPDDPADGDAYLVASGATGDWADYDGRIASCIDGAWTFYTPYAGMRAYVASLGAILIYTGSAWQGLVSSAAPASATATGYAGQIAFDASYLYVCTATDTWVRTAIATWT